MTTIWTLLLSLTLNFLVRVLYNMETFGFSLHSKLHTRRVPCTFVGLLLLDAGNLTDTYE